MEQAPLPALETGDMSAYLDRLGLSAPPERDRSAVGTLQLAHLHKIPFENLDIHFGTSISLDPSRIVRKLIHERRGGFCYELNGGFAALLASLGFDVTLLEARVYDGEEVGIPFDHLCLRVDLDRPYLVDVGFGASFDKPIILEPGVRQHDPAGVFEIVDRGEGHFDLLKDGTRQYRFTLTPRRLDEFTDACRHHQGSPDSPFTRNTVCSLRTSSGRVTVRGLTLIETVDGAKSERNLDPDEVAEVYAARFGLHLATDQIQFLTARA